MKIVHLRCEYAENPLGVGVLRPRLSWQLASDIPGARQSAYQIQASSDDNLEWDSGKVASDRSLFVAYDGPALHSRQRITWKVRAWDQDGKASPWSKPAWWEMGLLERNDWAALWIGAPLAGGARTTVPAPFLRKAFTIGAKVLQARLYVTALGLYEASINGQRIGDAELAPGWTNYDRRLLYQVYDVTSLLKTGENMLGAILGDGWYCGHVGWRDRQRYGDRPRLLAQLEITLAKGEQDSFDKMLIVSDRSWQTTFGPILASDLLMGEGYDARRELAGWNLPQGETAAPKGPAGGPPWQPVEIFPAPQGMALVAQSGPSVKCHEELKPVADPRKIERWPTAKWIFDLGQNMVGRVRLKVKGPAGTTIHLRHAEALNPDGTLYTTNLRSARATDDYTLKGDPAGETWEPRFTFHGFRYVELSGLPGTPNRDTLTGIVLNSENPVTGSFECSDPQINQLQHNILWGWKGNSLDVPTDCPQRDERLGWTGDVQVFCRTAAFNTNAAGFFAKWLQDLEDSQGESGQLPSVAPDIEKSNNDGGPAWADAGVIVPWTMYLAYGDKRLLAERYGMMVRFLEYLVQTSPGYIRVNQTMDSWEDVDTWPPGGYGDWLALDGSSQREGNTPKDLIGTAFFAYSARLMSQIAAVLEKEGDATRYERLYQDIRTAFQKRFVTPDGLIVSSTQTSYVLPLAFDLLPENLRRQAAITLVRDIRKKANHLGTGFVGTHFLPFVLTEAGQLAVAYDLLFQEHWPSWLYAVTQGATTIWERWDGWTHDRGFQDPGMNSFNHYAYGAIGDWLYRVVAGINPDWERPAYKHTIFRPQPPADGRLTYARASLQSPYGLVGSAWKIEAGRFSLEVVVPPNTTATVYLPGETEGRQVAAGKHTFVCDG
ncbi:MAG: family 78 glycoside hydrolase catalytic domain [Chloroflexota bacterium]